MGYLDRYFRLSKFDVRAIAAASEGAICFTDKLYSLISDSDELVAFNALRIFNQYPENFLLSLSDRSDELIDRLLAEPHKGIQRLLLSLLLKLPVSEAYKRIDFIDYAFSGINSAEPCAIRVLCLKHAYAICCRYPEFESELRAAIEILESEQRSPGLESACRHIFNQLKKQRLN